MLMSNNLKKRMKQYRDYINFAQDFLIKRIPVAISIRLDEEAFHTLKRSFKKPFDEIFINAMINTMKSLCEKIQECVFGYMQSDEIILILINNQTFETDAWCNYKIQKMCSISASMATMFFDLTIRNEITNRLIAAQENDDISELNYLLTLERSITGRDVFDSRCFNIIEEDVCDLLYERQLDAIRKSVLMVGQSEYSLSALQYKSCKKIREMLIQDGKKPWEEYPLYLQRGVACYKINDNWIVDKQMPMLTGNGRFLVEDRIYIEEE